MMSTPKPLHDTSADRSTKVMGLALRDVNESLAGSLGIAEGTSEYMNLTSSVSDTVENFIGDGSAISIKLTEELFKLTSEVKNTIKTLLKKPTDVEEISGLSPCQTPIGTLAQSYRLNVTDSAIVGTSIYRRAGK